MSIVEDVILNSKVAVTKANKKACEMLDLSKLKFNLIEINSQLQKLFQELGYMTYQAQSKNEEMADTSKIISDIAELREQALIIRDRMDALKKIAKCPVCDTKHAKEAVYCSKCGVKFSDFEEQTDEVEDEVKELAE